MAGEPWAGEHTEPSALPPQFNLLLFAFLGRQLMNAAEATLPQNIDAEKAILGAVLLDNSAHTEAAEFLLADDFSLDSHRRIFLRMCGLMDAHHAVDIVTLAEELARYKEIEQVGGVAYIAGLTEGLPRRPVIEEYIKIVKDKALLRSIMAVSSAAIARASDQSETAFEVGAAAQTQLDRLLTRGVRSNLISVGDYLQQNFPTPASMVDKAARTIGLKTGIAEFDEMTCGLQRSELIIIAARPSLGKAQPLTANVLTPNGFIAMGRLEVGMRAIGSDGKAHRIIGIYPQGNMPVFDVTFSDGTATRCTDDHLWWTQTRNERRNGLAGSVKTLSDIRGTILRPDGRSPNHAVPLVRPVEYEARSPLQIHPYVLGVLLGDGCLSNGNNAKFSNPEPDIFTAVQSKLPSCDRMSISKDQITCTIARRTFNKTQSQTARALSRYGLMGATSTVKWIPDDYMFASLDDRTALLMGLLDTDGHVNAVGSTVEYSTSSARLADDVTDLARSLGLRVSVKSRIPRYFYAGEDMEGRLSFRILIGAPDLTRIVSSEKHLARARSKSKIRAFHKSIVAIEPAGCEECQCIKVSAPDSLYVTDDFIVTHNTAFITNVSERAAVDNGLTVAGFSLEMSREALMIRMICSRSHVNMQRFRSGALNQVERSYFANAHDEFVIPNLLIDDTPKAPLAYIRNACRALKNRGPLDLVWIDHLGLMSTEGAPNKYNRAQEVGWLTGGLKALAKELDVPVVVLCQLSRGLTARQDKRPILSDLRESGDIEQDADLVAFLHREEYYEPTDENKGKGELIVAKQRQGPTGICNCAYDATITRWADQNTYVPMGVLPW